MLTRTIQRTLYSLKREYGDTLDVYQRLSSSVDPRTGVPATSKKVHHVRRAVVLPETLTLLEKRGISLISANKQLVQGGQWESGIRLLLIDRADLPGVALTTDDWAVIDGQKYEFETVQNYADAAWIVKSRASSGDRPQQIHHLWAESVAAFESGSGSA